MATRNLPSAKFLFTQTQFKWLWGCLLFCQLNAIFCHTAFAGEGLLCSAVFSEPSRIDQIALLDAFRGKIDLVEQIKRSRLTPNFQEQGKLIHYDLRVDSYSSRGNPHTYASILYRTTSVEKIVEPTNSDLPSSVIETTTTQQSRSILEDAAKTSKEFSFGQYLARRPHWTDSFYRRFGEIGKKYLYNSTFVQIFGNNDIRTNADPILLGNIRFVEEMDGQVPMEEYLQIHFNSNYKTKVEPGAFAIRHEMNSDTFGELLVGLLNYGQRHFISENRRVIFLTFVDRQSRMMYKKLGFRPIREDELEIPPHIQITRVGSLEQGILISRDEVDWMPMTATYEQLMEVLFNLEDIRQSRLLQSSENDRLVRRLGQLSQPGLAPANVTTYNVAREFAQDSHEIRVLQKGLFEKDPVRIQLSASTWEWNGSFPKQATFIRNFYFWTQESVQPFLKLQTTLPTEIIPMHDGFTGRYGNSSITYKFGILTIEQPGSQQFGGNSPLKWDRERIELTITPDLQAVTRARIKLSAHEREEFWEIDF